MKLNKIFLPAVFFSIVPLSNTLGQDFPVKDDVKFNDIQVNIDDFKPKEAEKNKQKKPSGATMLANCKNHLCTPTS